ncbi:unnamed protein product [Linum trigynum]|uniref:Uncharacterized protein n=1 Tax=Linum trigynum TaxID=586398 RepID=A0AAV2CBY8_9ROSI
MSLVWAASISHRVSAQYSPASWSMQITNSQLGKDKPEKIRPKSLSKQICKLKFRADFSREEVTSLNSFSNKEAIHLDLLGTLVEDWIVRYVKENLFVTVKRSRPNLWHAKLTKKPLKPDELTDRAGHSTVVGFSGNLAITRCCLALQEMGAPPRVMK